MADFEDETNDSDQEMKQKQKQKQDVVVIGRGHVPSIQNEMCHPSKSGHFDSLNDFDQNSSNKNVQKSVEGYVLFVTNIHEEAKDDDIYEKFSEWGHVKQFNVPLDRRTGFVKGYALIQFTTFKEAQAAINGVDQTQLYNKILSVDWAFISDS